MVDQREKVLCHLAARTHKPQQEHAVPTLKVVGWDYNDGGRADAGYRGHAGDCCTRAVAIATDRTYEQARLELMDATDEWLSTGRDSKKKRAIRASRRNRSVRGGVHTEVMELYLGRLGWTQHKVSQEHFTQARMPEQFAQGTVIVKTRKHFAAVVDGTLQDTWDSRTYDHPEWGQGERKVYRVWTFGDRDD